MYRAFHEGRSSLETTLFALNFYGLVIGGAGVFTNCTTAAVIGCIMGCIGTGFFFLQSLFEED